MTTAIDIADLVKTYPRRGAAPLRAVDGLTVDVGTPATIALEAGAFVLLVMAGFVLAIRSLEEA